MTHQKYLVTKETVAEDQLVFGGLLAVSVVVLMELLGKDNLDTPLTIALFSFAISIPLLTLRIVTVHKDATCTFTVDPWYINYPTALAPIITFVALGAVFWHFSRLVGLIFLGVGLYTFIAALSYMDAVDTINKPKQPEKQTDAITDQSKR